jgi:hypothetical protein
MFDGDGAETLELQAYTIAKNATMYSGSHPCPSCGVMMNPVEALHSKGGICPSCDSDRKARRVKGKMA